MLHPNGSSVSASGFEGAVVGLGLPDVIQMNGLNRFSGLLSVVFESNAGALFFRDGEIIHAEVGDKNGEAAFYEIVCWTSGKFELQPNVTTTTQSIERSWKFLLLDAHRRMDEERRIATSGHPHPEGAPAALSGRERPATVTERIRRIPGVLSAVFQTKDGTRTVDDDTEPLVAGADLGRLGRRLGEIFNTGDVVAASVQGPARQLLLLATKTSHLDVVVEGGSQVAAVEAEIRKLVASRH